MLKLNGSEKSVHPLENKGIVIESDNGRLVPFPNWNVSVSRVLTRKVCRF